MDPMQAARGRGGGAQFQPIPVRVPGLQVTNNRAGNRVGAGTSGTARGQCAGPCPDLDGGNTKMEGPQVPKSSIVLQQSQWLQ